MNRPLMQHGVGQLEDLFGQSKGDAKVLKQLEHELQYRQVPRAVALLAEVQALLYGARSATPIAPPASTPPRQQDLWVQPPPSTPPATPTVPAPRSLPAAHPPKATTATPAVALEVPPMSVEDACKVLKVTPAATWEAIEQTRRQLVQQASPARTGSVSSERRAQVLAEARRVNLAYASLARARERGR